MCASLDGILSLYYRSVSSPVDVLECIRRFNFLPVDVTIVYKIFSGKLNVPVTFPSLLLFTQYRHNWATSSSMFGFYYLLNLVTTLRVLNT